jgi:hypothetical protein
MIPLNINLRTGSVCWKQTLKAVQQSPGMVKQKDRAVKKSVGKLERIREKKYSIAWKQSREGNGTNASRERGPRFDVRRNIKPNAPLANFVEYLRKLGKDLTKQDLTEVVGGAGKSLDTNQDYSVDKDLNFMQRGQVTQMWDSSTYSGDMTSRG